MDELHSRGIRSLRRAANIAFYFAVVWALAVVGTLTLFVVSVLSHANGWDETAVRLTLAGAVFGAFFGLLAALCVFWALDGWRMTTEARWLESR
jgi:hypothetical protein